MREIGCMVLGLLNFAAGVSGQETRHGYDPNLSRVSDQGERIYYAETNLVPPVLRPFALANRPEKCSGKLQGNTVLKLVVDATGHPRNVMFERANGDALDGLAVKVAEADTFEPGTLNGQAVPVGVLVEIDIHACSEMVKESGGKSLKVQLENSPVQKVRQKTGPDEQVSLDQQVRLENGAEQVLKVGRGVTAPMVLISRDAEYSDYARRHKIQGNCLMSLVVDARGFPQDVKIVRSVDKSLDREAISAVKSYRFRPALQNGRPVAVKISLNVSFKLY